MHWSLKQSNSQLLKKGTVITVKFNTSTKKCETKTSDEHKHCTTQP